LFEFGISLACCLAQTIGSVGFDLELGSFAAMWTMAVADANKPERSGRELVSVIGYGGIGASGTKMRNLFEIKLSAAFWTP
jgi:hypothetical protein